MRTKKMIQLCFVACFSLISCTGEQRAFDQAIGEIRDKELSHVNSAKSGLPYYSIRTLDPNWEENGATPIIKIQNLSLVDQDGLARDQTLFDGKATFIAFFFTSCSGFCPVFIKHLQSVERKLKDVPDMQYVAISVDPETDHPHKLKQYLKKMKLNPKKWILLTGNRDLIYSLARETFASEAFRLPKSGQIAHSEHFYFIDSKRRLRGVLNGTRLNVAESAFQLISDYGRSTAQGT